MSVHVDNTSTVITPMTNPPKAGSLLVLALSTTSYEGE